FEAAFDAVQSKAMSRLGEIVTGPGHPWETAMAALRGFVRVCLDPSFQRIVVHEGPVVMGWERWREAEEHFSFGVIRTSVEVLVNAGEIDDLPIDVSARLLYGALSAGASMIASSDDPRRTSEDVIKSTTRI